MPLLWAGQTSARLFKNADLANWTSASEALGDDDRASNSIFGQSVVSTYRLHVSDNSRNMNNRRGYGRIPWRGSGFS
jgi:hypothetical protein